MIGLWTLVKIVVVVAPCYPSLGCTIPSAPAISSGRVEHLSYDTCQLMAQQFNADPRFQSGAGTTYQAACVQDGQADAALAAYAAKIGAVQ